MAKNAFICLPYITEYKICDNLCEDARISGSKGNPKCLRKLYLSTRAGVESNISLLVEQAMERMLEQEQFTIGWEDQ